MATSDAPLLFVKRYLGSSGAYKACPGHGRRYTNLETTAETPRPPRKAIESFPAHLASWR